MNAQQRRVLRTFRRANHPSGAQIRESVRRVLWSDRLFLPRPVGGLLLDRGYRLFGGYKNHFRYHQDGENRHKQKNVSAKSTQVEVFHGQLIGRNNPAE